MGWFLGKNEMPQISLISTILRREGNCSAQRGERGGGGGSGGGGGGGVSEYSIVAIRLKMPKQALKGHIYDSEGRSPSLKKLVLKGQYMMVRHRVRWAMLIVGLHYPFRALPFSVVHFFQAIIL